MINRDRKLSFAELRKLAGYDAIPKQVIDRDGTVMHLNRHVWVFNVVQENAYFDWRPIKGNPWIEFAIKKYCAHQLTRVSPIEVLNTIHSIMSALTVAENLRSLLGATDVGTHCDRLVNSMRTSRRVFERENKLYRMIRPRAWYVWCAQNIPEMGFDEDFAFEIEQAVIPGNEMGVAVRTEDPAGGPLDDIELSQILLAIERDAETNHNFEALQQRCALMLCVAFGRNAANYCLLREEDIYVLAPELKEQSEWGLRIPRIKKRDRPRAQFREEVLTERLHRELAKLQAMNLHMVPRLPGIERPLFIRRHPRPWLADGPLREWSMHMTSKEFHLLLKRAIKRYGIVSARTGASLNITARRLRYTLATNLVRLGVGAAQLAEILDHSDTQCVRVYFDARSAIVEQLDKAMLERMAPIIHAFRGHIVDRAGDFVNSDKPGKRIAMPYEAVADRSVEACFVGACGKKTECHLKPPYSCYLCRKFQPFRDGAHDDVVDFLLVQRTNLAADRRTQRLAPQLDMVIMAAQEVAMLSRASS